MTTPNTPASADIARETALHLRDSLFTPILISAVKPTEAEFLFDISSSIQSAIDEAIERDRAERDAPGTSEIEDREACISDLEHKLAEREAELAAVRTLLQDSETTLGLNMLEQEKLKEGLKFIHEIAYEKCRTGEDDGNCASIESIARGCLGLKADDGFENIPNLQAKLAEQSAALAYWIPEREPLYAQHDEVSIAHRRKWHDAKSLLAQIEALAKGTFSSGGKAKE